MDTILFTPASLLSLLAQVDELQDLDLSMSESLDGNLQLQIGNSFYDLDISNSEVYDVEPEVVEDIEDLNAEVYQDIDTGDTMQDVESGLLKEVAKTLLVGGVVRLASKLLRK